MATAAKGRSPRRFSDAPGIRSSALREADITTPVRSRASSRRST